jgi:hypothetical protein
VSGVARGDFTRKQATAARAKLWQELFVKLEREVAVVLRLPGRSR